MDNLIDATYFWGELEIDGLFTNQASGIALMEAGGNSASELDQYIAKYQKYYLEQMFGKPLAANLPAELIALIRDEQLKTSLITNCVYYFYMYANESKTTGAGEVKMDIIRTRSVSAQNKIIKAWNEMVNKTIEIHQKLYEEETITVTIDDVETELNYIDDIRYQVLEKLKYSKEDKIYELKNRYF